MHMNMELQRDISVICTILCDVLFIITNAQCSERKTFNRIDQLRITEPNQVDTFFLTQKCEVNPEIVR